MTDVAQAYVRLRPRADGFEREAEAQVRGAGAMLGSVFAIAFGAAAGVGLGKATIEAAERQQQSLSQVMQLTKQAGASNTAYGKSIKDNLVDLADESGFTVEELADAFARLQSGVKDTARTLDLLGSATETARGRGQDLVAVSTALAKVQAGQTSGLARLGIVTKAYTGAQDEVKARLLEVQHAETALSQSRDTRYKGTIKLTESERRIAAMTDAQRATLVENIKAQLDSAKASDKQATAQQALAELQQRYAGQNQIFGATAQGQVARFHEAINELEVTVGQALLPSLASAAETGRRWAQDLADSGDAARVVQGTVEGLAGAADVLGTAFRATEPALRLLAEATEAIGPGPILALTAAWYGLQGAQTVAAIAEGQYMKLVAAGEAVFAERAAALELEQLAQRRAAASRELAAVAQRTEAFAAQIATVGLDAETIALTANMDALIAETEALLGASVAQAELGAATAATTVALEAEAVAGAEAAVATGGLRAAGAGLLSVLTGPAGIVAGVALLVGGLYYLSTRESEVEKQVNSLTDAFERQTEAAKTAADARDAAQVDTNALPSLRQGRGDALDEITKAQDAYDKLALSGHATRQSLAKDAEAIAIAQAHWRDTNRQVLSTERDKVEQLAKSKRAVEDGKKATQDAARAALDLVPVAPEPGIRPGRFGNLDAVQQAAKVRQAYNDLNRAADDASKHLTEDQRERLRTLADEIKRLGGQPTQVEVDLILNTDAAKEALLGFKGSVFDVGDEFFGLGPPDPGTRGARALAVPISGKKKGLKEGKEDAEAYTTSFVQTIDAGAINDALVSAIASAQSNATSQASSLASAIGDQLDERLRRSVASLDAQSKALQDRISQREAAATARSTQLGSEDAAVKLKQLQDVLGTGPLTADQQLQLQAAKNAVLDAQDSIANAQDQSALSALSARKDALAQANELEKIAANRRISDLTDELNRGLISQATYVKGVRGLLAKEDVSYKSAGALLGRAFADGFADSLSSLLSQVKELGLLGQGQLKGAQKGTKPVSPVGDEAKAIQAFIDQVAGSSGRFNVTNAGSLPKGVDLGALLSAAGEQRATASYREKSSRQTDDVIHYTGRTADHTREILVELRKANKPTVVVVKDSDGKRKAAQATR